MKCFPQNNQRLFRVFVLVCVFFIVSVIVMNLLNDKQLEVNSKFQLFETKLFGKRREKPEPETPPTKFTPPTKHPEQPSEETNQVLPTTDKSTALSDNFISLPPLSCKNYKKSSFSSNQELCDREYDCGFLKSWK